MTSFGDVNVGDKVRLTAENGAEHVTVILEVAENGSCIRDEMHGWYYPQYWSVEVLEPAPKPLPTEPGFYRQKNQHRMSPGAYLLAEDGRWHYVYGVGTVSVIDDPQHEFANVELIALVPESPVEEARAEVVKEIVKFLYRHDDRSWDVAANKVDLTFSKSLGGKA